MLVACEVKIMENVIATRRKSVYPVRSCKYNLAIEQFSLCLPSALKHMTTNAFRFKIWVSGQFDLSSRLTCTLKENCYVLKHLKSLDSYKAKKQGNWELQISMALNTGLQQLMRLLGVIGFASASKDRFYF